MRRIMLSLVALSLFFGGTSAAMASPYNHHRGYYGRPVYRSYHRPYYGGYRGPVVPVVPAYGAGCAVPGYAAPGVGFGVAGQNFSLWMGR